MGRSILALRASRAQKGSTRKNLHLRVAVICFPEWDSVQFGCWLMNSVERYYVYQRWAYIFGPKGDAKRVQYTVCHPRHRIRTIPGNNFSIPFTCTSGYRTPRGTDFTLYATYTSSLLQCGYTVPVGLDDTLFHPTCSYHAIAATHTVPALTSAGPPTCKIAIAYSHTSSKI